MLSASRMQRFTDVEIDPLNHLQYHPDEPAYFDGMRSALRWCDEKYLCGGEAYNRLLDYRNSLPTDLLSIA